jgi:hypothetical protein
MDFFGVCATFATGAFLLTTATYAVYEPLQGISAGASVRHHGNMLGVDAPTKI